MNYKNMGTSDRGKAQPPQQQPTPSTPFPLARLQSVYSLTFDEFQNTLVGPGKDFGSMNMDEFLRNIWTAEESQAMTYNLGSAPDSSAPAGNSGTLGIQRQGSLTLPRTLSQKTVDEVWKDLFKETVISGQVPEITQQNRQPTLGEVTLEEFLVRAGVVREENNINLQQQSSSRAQESSMNASNYMFFGNGNPGLDLGFAQNSSGVASTRPFQAQLQVGSNIDNGRGRMVGIGDQRMNNGLMNGVPGLGRVTVETVRSPDGIGKSNGDLSSLWPDQYHVFGSGTRGRKCSGSVEKVVERRQKRMIKNRESAARSRERKQAYTMELEAEVAKLKEQNQELEKKQAEIMETQKNQVLVPIGFGSEEMEAVIIVNVLRRAGANVLLASVEEKLQVECSSGTKLEADVSIQDCVDEIFDLVALPGGMPGSVRLRDNDALRNITTKQAEEKRIYGAICAAPAVTLKPWGLLKKKQITCHPAFMDKIPSFRVVKSNIQVSGDLTTSRGPGTTFEFALSFVEQLFGNSLADAVGEKLLMTDSNGHKKEEFNRLDWSFDHTPRVLIPIANGCEEIEVVILADILRRAKVDVVLASVEKSMKVVAFQQMKIIADKSINEASESIYDLIVLPGGVTCTEKLQKSRVLKQLLKEQKAAGRIYGGFSSSHTILSKQGLLKGKNVVSHLGIDSKVSDQALKETRVVIDGKLITGAGLSSAIDFSLAIVNKLFGQGRVRSLVEGIVYEYRKS